MAVKADIYDLINHHCTSRQIGDFLRKFRDAGAEAISISGKKEELIQHLKDAVAERFITQNDMAAFLREAEENGNQHIFFFVPTTTKAKRRCANRAGTAELLFTSGLDTMNFPLFDRLPSNDREYIWSDFREVVNSSPGWIGKIYGVEVELVLKKE
jgi:hypothetical protein